MQRRIRQVGALLVVGSGKGGVGKSTGESDTLKGDPIEDERED